MTGLDHDRLDLTPWHAPPPPGGLAEHILSELRAAATSDDIGGRPRARTISLVVAACVGALAAAAILWLVHARSGSRPPPREGGAVPHVSQMPLAPERSDEALPVVDSITEEIDMTADPSVRRKKISSPTRSPHERQRSTTGGPTERPVEPVSRSVNERSLDTDPSDPFDPPRSGDAPTSVAEGATPPVPTSADLIIAARDAATTMRWPQALALSEEALRRGATVTQRAQATTIAALAACNLKNRDKARTYWVQMKEHRRTLVRQACLQHDIDPSAAPEGPRDLIELGRQAANRGSWTIALLFAERALDNSPDEDEAVEAHELAGTAACNLGRPFAAEAHAVSLQADARTRVLAHCEHTDGEPSPRPIDGTRSPIR